MLDDAGDWPSRWLYIQFAVHHHAPAPGQNHCPGSKGHFSPLSKVTTVEALECMKSWFKG